ncbi:hypothetical protein K3X48_01275 [Aliiroseovarius crassostreae]|uniref:Uncharacterized protein n=1 Tax=Aliiroseovarius crassostreae TaxID=154981 RepID=A0A9Q9LVA2_9RHOB|nr:hypothetical protein [Aliiroseovarius crassostreae]UWP95671.1 hypothetical protein K3X48_01275 [Aliiroseovarius crassostreae]
MDDLQKKWADFLNPEVVRYRLLTSGVFLVAHEVLIDTITRQPLKFFSNKWSAEKGWEVSEAYKANVLDLDPKKKGDRLRSSLEWWRLNGAISGSDISEFKEIVKARNQFAHELSNHVGSGSGPKFEEIYPQLVELLLKIERWWILNVEMATDEEWAGIEVEIEDIVPGKKILLEIMELVTLGDQEKAWKLYNDFVRSDPN